MDEDLYRLYIRRISGYAIYTMDPGGAITSWNHGVEKVLGFAEDEFVGQNGRIIFTPEDKAAGIPEQELATAAEKSTASDDRWTMRKDGSVFWAGGLTNAIRDGDDKLLGFAKVVRDRTDTKRLQEKLQEAHDALEQRVEERTRELRASEERFAVAFHASPAPTYIVRLSDQQFLDVNESFLALTGYARDEVLGHTPEELGFFVDAAQRREVLKTLDKGGTSPTQEVAVRSRIGTVHHVLAASSAITLDGEPCSLGAFVDISAHKRTERDLMRALTEVLQDTTTLTRSVMEKLAEIKAGHTPGVGLADLTERERQVMELVARGMSNARIGEELGISGQTVRNYIATIYQKIDVHSRAEAVVWARERGLGGP